MTNPPAAVNPQQSNTIPAWWGRFDYTQPGITRSWSIASLHLWVRRAEREWCLAFLERAENIADETIEAGIESSTITESAEQERYLFRTTPNFLRVVPALAPRPVVVRPVMPMRVPGGESVSLYVTTPLWMQFQSGDTGKTFRELAIVRPSDTWFGENTREGQLCYAARTPGQLELSDLRPKPQQAITCINIRNTADDLLEFDRINLPVTYLSLYSDPGNRLWTENITFVRTRDANLAKLDIDKVPPPHLSRATRVATPREKAPNGLLMRAFNALFA